MVQSYEYKVLWTSGIVWSDTSDKEGKTLLETQVKLSEIMTETNKNTKIKHTLQPLKLCLPKTKHYIS